MDTMLQDVQQVQTPDGNVVEKKTALDYWLWATLVFLVLMILANLLMAWIASFAIPPQIKSSYVFGTSIVFLSFLFVLAFQKSFILLCYLRASSLKFLSQESLESVDYWAREENIVHEKKIGHLCTNIFLCTVSLYFTAVVFQFFYANVSTTAYRGSMCHEYHGSTLFMLVLVFFIIHSLFLAETKLFREQNERYRYPIVPFWDMFVPYFVMNFCFVFITRNIHLTFFPPRFCC